MDNLLKAFKKCEVKNSDKMLGGTWWHALLAYAIHENGLMSECWETDICGDTTLTHDYENGESHTHKDGEY